MTKHDLMISFVVKVAGAVALKRAGEAVPGQDMQINFALVVWAALGLIWGSNFIFMKWAADFITPSQIVLARVAIGFAAIFVFASLTGRLSKAHLGHWVHYLAIGFLTGAIYYYGAAKGTSLLPSGIAGAITGATPLVSLVVSLMFLPDEKLTGSKFAGLIVGFIGVLLIADPFSEGLAGASTEGALYMILCSLGIGGSFVYARKFLSPLKVDPAAVTTYQLGFATIILLMISDVSGLGAIAQSPKALWGLVLGLGLFGTGIAFIMYFYIVDQLGAIRASSVSYLPPIVALFIGAVLVGEEITIVDYLATALIFAGVVLVNWANTKAQE